MSDVKVNSIEEVFDYVRKIDNENRQHVTKGYKLGEIGGLDILKKTAGELIELTEATTKSIAKMHSSKDFIQDELGDTVSCLIHLAIRYGIGPKELAQTMVDKLELRFAGEIKK